MVNFQKITIIIATVILIIFLLMIGISLYKNKDSSQYPPVVADCPDYWLDMSDGTSSKCINKQGLGSSVCSDTMNFSGGFWTGDNGMCRKNQWAKKCDLTWDGVTNKTGVCDTSS